MKSFPSNSATVNYWFVSPPTYTYVEVLTPNISECDLIWKEGHYGGNQVKSSHSGNLASDWCPYRKGKSGHRYRHTQREDSVGEHGGEDGQGLRAVHPQSKAKDGRQTPEPRRSKGVPPRAVEESTALLTPEFWTSRLYNCETVSSVLLSKTVFGTFLCSPRKLMQPPSWRLGKENIFPGVEN